MVQWMLLMVLLGSAQHLSVPGCAASAVGNGISTLSTDVVNAAQGLIAGTTVVVDNKLGITQPPATTAAPPGTAAPAAIATPAPYVPQPFMPIPYTHLWVSSDGNTHIAECTVQNLTLSAYGGVSGLLSASYNDLLVNATLALFVQLPAGQYNPPHNAPVSQFGLTMQGSWYAETSDGSVRHFMPGNLLFQDNTPLSPAANTPNAARHISGNDATVPCDVLGIQVVFPPTVDHPCPF